MGLLDYIRANTPRATTPRVSPAKVFNEGLLNPNAYNKPAADRFKDSLFGGLGIVPGVGDVASGMEAADLWNRGDKGSAMLAGLGVLPFIPAMTKFEKAHEIASKNAEEMLGLPKGNTYIDRAKALGFNTTGFHGTDASTDFKRFKPTPNDETGIKGVSFALEPSQANFFAEGRGMHNGEFDGRIIKAKIRGTPPVDYISAMERIQNQRVPPETLMGEERVLRKHLKDADSVGIDYSNSIGGTEISVVDPSRIRSMFAAFDPARVNESDLLAGLAPYLGVGGLLSLGLLTPEEAQAK